MSTTIVIANKRYSSWSMRPWLALRHAAGKDGFKEILCNLNCEGGGSVEDGIHPYSEIERLSPTKKVPLLIDHRFGDLKVWESIAIMLHIADTFPEANLLPKDPVARALCYSVISEMHAGFNGLRQNLAVHTVGTGRQHGAVAMQLPAVRADVHRIGTLWTELRTRFQDQGPFLLGSFSLADCMYTPVCFRFTVYDPELESLQEFPLAQEYVRMLRQHEYVLEWVEGAKKEKENTFLPHYECLIDK